MNRAKIVEVLMKNLYLDECDMITGYKEAASAILDLMPGGEWEKEFDKSFYISGTGYLCKKEKGIRSRVADDTDVKDFIRSLLSRQQSEFVEALKTYDDAADGGKEG